jgi:hypothetical protein
MSKLTIKYNNIHSYTNIKQFLHTSLGKKTNILTLTETAIVVHLQLLTHHSCLLETELTCNHYCGVSDNNRLSDWDS